MANALLDTSFILTCVNQKIDFVEEIYLFGLKIIVPKQVIKEINSIAKLKKGITKETAKLATKILQKSKFKEINLEGKNVDKAIIKFANKNKNIVIATLDKEIQQKTENKKMIIRGKKKLEIV